MTVLTDPVAAPVTAPVTAPMARALGWELSYTGHGHDTKTSAGSDKFYRAFVIDSTVVFHFGRRGTAGQFKVHHCASFRAAGDLVTEMVAKKEAKGYRTTQGTTIFQVPSEVARAAGTSDSRFRDGDPQASRQITEAWLAKIGRNA